MPSLLATLLLADAVEKDGWSEDAHPRDEKGRFAGAGFTAAGADPKLLAQAAGRAARMGLGGSKELAAEAKQRARAAGAPKGQSVRAGAGARAAVRRELGTHANRPPDFKPRVVEPKPPVDLKPPIDPKPGDLEAIENHLITAAIVENKRDDGGVNETRFLKFDDGSKAVFKPQDGAAGSMRYNITAGKDMNREVAAYQVAKLVGMTDMVPATVFRTIGGRIGSVQNFVPNSVQAFERMNQWDGEKDQKRAAVFDYVIGNEDRHEGNWMLNKTTDKVALIDHGLCFPEEARIDGPQGFASLGLRLSGSPGEHAAPYVQNKAAILDSLRAVGLPRKAVEGVRTRIDNLASPVFQSPHGWVRIKDGE